MTVYLPLLHVRSEKQPSALALYSTCSTNGPFLCSFSAGSQVPQAPVLSATALPVAPVDRLFFLPPSLSLSTHTHTQRQLTASWIQEQSGGPPRIL